MKKFNIFVILMIFSFFLLLSSCDRETTTSYPVDKTLSGSVSNVNHRIKQCTGTFDGATFKNLQPNLSSFRTVKVSDEMISLNSVTTWDDVKIDILFPTVPLSGESYDVKFNFSSVDAKVTYNDITYKPASTTINGWIKREGDYNDQKGKKSGKNLSDPASFLYSCDINIKCTIDGKELSLKITSVSP